MTPRLLASLARIGAAVIEATGPADVRERLRRAAEDALPDDQIDALGAELDLLAGLLAGR
jgi:hypothetical protein